MTSNIPLESLDQYVASNRHVISKQFDGCPSSLGASMSYYGSKKVLMPKNIFYYYPYDHNRVKIEMIDGVEASDYINASFIPAYESVASYSFIAAQGPFEKSVEDFWRMICEHNVNVIIMLTNCSDGKTNKYFQYWPKSEIPLKVGNILVKVLEEKITLNHNFRVLSVDSKFQKNQKVVHILFPTWLDLGVPVNVVSLLNLREKMLSFIDSSKTNTIVVHCSAGVGRTGTFIALDYLLHQAKHTGYVDVLECLKFLREQRCNMIETREQYELCFRVVSIYNAIGDCTYISLNDELKCNGRLKELKTANGNLSLMEKQFKVIEMETKKAAEMDSHGSKQQSTSELNIVYASSLSKINAFIIGKKTSPLSTNDLLMSLELRVDILIFLDVAPSEKDHLFGFIPGGTTPMLLPNEGFIKMINFEKAVNGLTIYDLEIFCRSKEDSNSTDATNKSDFTFIYVNSTNQLKPVSYDVLRTIHGKSFCGRDKITMVLGCCYDDPAYLVAGLNLLEMMDEENEIDIYQIVFELKLKHPECFSDYSLYQSLYGVAEDHLSSRKT